MSRHFAAAAGDYIDVAPGALAALDGGPWSLAVLWRPTSSHDGCFVQGVNSGGYEAWMAEPVSDGRVYHSVGGSYRPTNTWTATDGWRIDGLSKASGAGQAVRGHQALLGGAWTHADYGTASDTTNVPVTAVRIGRFVAGWGGLNGDLAALVVCGAVWSDAEFEALSAGLAAWMTAVGAAPGALWAFSQAATSDPVLDLTGGGADQVAISGTSISTDPPGWSYALAAPVSVSAAAALPALAGSATVAAANPVAVTATGSLPALASVLTAWSTTLQPNSELVAVAWLRTVLGLTAAMVSTRLPTDTTLWEESGFVTVGGGDGTGAVIGGSPNREMPLRAPVVSVHCWAVKRGSGRPPWGKAAQLAELIVTGTYDETRMRRQLTLPSGYQPARLNEAYALSEPRRIPADPSGYAHFQLDLQLHWVATA